jgi:hypothetical protein
MSNSTDAILVDTYRFTPADLNAGDRLPGISAFMRIKNGADFLEAAIRSHIAHVDEIVAVHNQCTDRTPEILARLTAEFGPKLRVYHYLPAVFPPGSEGHANEPADSPRSLINYYNFALTRTRYRIVTKLDDDHIAMTGRMASLIAGVAAKEYRLADLVCFSGVNLAANEAGRIGVYAREPFVGTGDHWFLDVGPDTYFVHDRRFERLQRGKRRRVFADFAYWHLKHLKTDFGFANYGIGATGNPRYERKQRAFLANREVIALAELQKRAPVALSLLAALPLPERRRFQIDRWMAMRHHPPSEAELAAMLAETGLPRTLA